MRPPQILLLLALLLTPRCSVGDDAAAAQKLPVPSREGQQRAAQRIRGVFPEPETAEKKLALAREVFGVALDEKDDTVRYSMLRYAGALAQSAGDLKSALHAVDLVQQRYEVDGLVGKQRVLERLLNEKTAAGVSRAALDGLNQAVGEERYTVAQAFGRIAYQAARLRKDQALIKLLRERALELSALKTAKGAIRPALATLRQRADDVAANRQVGTYLCFWRGDWQQGLPHLAQAGHPIAKLEMAEGKNTAAKLRIADLWNAEAKPDAPAKGKHIRRRAAFWYRAALPELAGLNMVRAQKRLRELGQLDRPAAARDPAIVGDPPPQSNGKKSARALAGLYTLLIAKTRKGAGTPQATLVLADEGSVTTADGQPFAKWTAQGKEGLRLSVRKPAGAVADFKLNADGTWRAALATNDGRKFWTLRPVVVAAVWELSDGRYSSPKAWRKTLYSNGRVDDPLQGETWTINGNAAKIGKRGFTIDPNGRFAKGRQQGGGMMFGRLVCRGLNIRLAALPKDKSSVAADERRFSEQDPRKRGSSIVDTYQLRAASRDRRALLDITIDLRADGGVFDHGRKVGSWSMKGARLKLALDFLGSEELVLGRSRTKFVATNRSLAGTNLSWSLERVMPVMTWQVNVGNQSRRLVFYSNGRIGAPHALACHGPWGPSSKGMRVWEAGCTLKSGGREFSGRMVAGGSISGVLVSRP